jgi:hypothetical protein
MTLRLSTALRDFVNNHGSLKDALHDGEIRIYTGSQPATADTAPSGTLLCTITAASQARTAEVLATGSVTLAGSAGSVNTITVDGVEVLGAAVAFDTDLTTTAAAVAAQINKFRSVPNYTATSSGAKVTIHAPRGLGAGANGFVVDATCTTLTSTDVAMGSETAGVSAVNGLRFGVSSSGVLVKDPTQVWSGVNASTGTAGWFRFTGSVADSGTTDSSAQQVRLDGAISTSGQQLNMSSTTLTALATTTLASFPMTLPTS